MFRQDPGEAFQGTGTGCRQHDLSSGSDFAQDGAGYRIIQIDLWIDARFGEIAPRLGRPRQPVEARRRLKRIEGQCQAATDQVLPAIAGEIEPSRRQGSIDGRAAILIGALQIGPRLIEIGDHIETRFFRVFDLIIERNDSLRQIGAQRHQGGAKQGQPMLHAGIMPTDADRFVKRIIATGGAEFGAIAGAETFNRCRGQADFIDLIKRKILDLLFAALGQRIEEPQILDLIAKEIDPDRLCGSRRKQIDDTAADGKFAGFADRPVAQIAFAEQKFDQSIRVQRGTTAQR